MEIETDYAVSLFFPHAKFPQVFFEAVANAIDANADEVKITIRSDGRLHRPLALEIDVVDNGTGFIDERFSRFKKTLKPQDARHKGLGRLVFLNYFREVAVTSIFGATCRRFTFSHGFRGDHADSEVEGTTGNTTTLAFRAFSRDRVHAADDLKPATIKAMLLDQFLPILIERKNVERPITITIELEGIGDFQQGALIPSVATLSLADIPEFKTKTITDPSLDAFRTVEIKYSLTRDQARRTLFTAASVDGRTIDLPILRDNAIPIGCRAIFLFESEMLGGRSDNARQRLILPDGLSERALHGALRQHVSDILAEELPEIIERNATTRKSFEDNYPHLTGLFADNTVGLIDADEAIEGTCSPRRS